MCRRAPSGLLSTGAAGRFTARLAAAGAPAATLGRLVATTTLGLRGACDRLLDALQIARLADESRQLRQAAALHADLGQDGVDQWRLHAIAQRGVDHLVGRVAARAPASSARESIDM